MKNNLQIGKSLFIGRQATGFGLSFTTMLTVGAIAVGYAGGNIYLQCLAGLGAAWMSYLAVDGRLDDLAPWVAAKTVTKEKKGKLYWLLVIFSLGLFLTTTTLTFWSRFVISDTVIEQADTEQETTAIRERTAANTASIETLRSELASMRKSEPARVKAAEKQADGLKKAAIQSGGANLATLYYSGNGWAAKKLRGKINNAESKGVALIQAERDRTTQAEKALAAALSAKDEVSVNLSQLAVSEVKAVENRKNKTSGVLLIFDLIFAFGYLLSTIGYALFESDYPALAKEIENPKLTWGGVFGKAFTDGNQAFLSFVSRKVLRVSVVSDVAPPNVSPIAYTATPAPKQPKPLFQTRPNAETAELLTKIERLRGGIRTQLSRMKNGKGNPKTIQAAIARNEKKIAALLKELEN